ncbi:MAG: NUDIX domain-containing protein [Gammaproteobacteria bacterium]|nr:NUDIX domain-containing protein [Gammaproteobacteria bacterium]
MKLGNTIMPTFKRSDCEIINCDRVFQGYFAIDKFTVKHRLFSGGWSNEFQREIFERGNAAAVLLYDPDLQKVILLEQFRMGALASDRSPWMIEVVAGIIEQGETPEEVARRESVEEAGQEIDQIIEIGNIFSTPGGSTEQLFLYCARVDASDADGIFGLEHENEDIRVFTMNLDDVRNGLSEGLFENATSIISLQWLLLNLEKVHNAWK